MTEAAKRDLIEEFMEEVERIAEEFQDGSVPAEDLIQEGYLGLLDGVNSLDSEAAGWSGLSVEETVTGAIRRAMEDAAGKYAAFGRDDERLVAQVELLNASIDRLTEELGTKPNIDEIANDMGISQETVIRILKLTGEEVDEDAMVRAAESDRAVPEAEEE